MELAFVILSASLTAAVALTISLLVLYLKKLKNSTAQQESLKHEFQHELERNEEAYRQKAQSIQEANRDQAVQIKQLELQLEKLQYRYDQQLALVQEKSRQIAELQGKEQNRIQDNEKQIGQLETARKHLEDERRRVIEEEERKREEEKQNRDRLWAMHEQRAVSYMHEVSSRAQTLFPSFDNTRLPDDFDDSLKPDFMIRFLGQYIIFDAKTSRSQKLDSYLAGQVKQTVRKIKESSYTDFIYKSLFFVIPTPAEGFLERYSYYEDGFSVYIIPLEAFEPLLAVFKKMESYDLADAYDPQEREDIIDIIASLEHHIRHQNAVQVLGTLRGIKTVAGREQLPEDLRAAVEERRKQIRLETFKPAQLKRLIHDPEALRDELIKILGTSGPAVTADELKHSEE